MITHIVTGGCSFSTPYKWPYRIQSCYPNKNFYNTGKNSAGNDFISYSMIFKAQSLLDIGISPDQILLIIMWSGFDRKSFWINEENTSEYHNLLSTIQPCNPFIKDRDFFSDRTRDDRGFLLGTINCNTHNPYINEWKKIHFLNYFSDEYAVIENYTYMLMVEWFCKSKKVNLLNLTFADLMHYPYMPFMQDTWHNKIPSIDTFQHAGFFQNMFDLKNWLFYNKTGGLYDMVKDLNLGFEPDNLHPDDNSNLYFANKFLIPHLQENYSL